MIHRFIYRWDGPIVGDSFGQAIATMVDVFVIPAAHFAGENGFDLGVESFSWDEFTGTLIGTEADMVVFKLRFPDIEFI